MKKLPVYFISFLLFLSCGSNQKKKHSPISSLNFINVVEGPEGSSSAYTEDGHTIIYETDSANNYIVYYAKFDDNAGKRGYERVKDKAIRIETDSSMNMLTSIVSAHGGASCLVDENGECHVFYFDEQMNSNNAEQYDIRLEDPSEGIGNMESKIKRIIYLLSVAYDVAKSINERNIGGWNYIVSALEPSQSILNHDVMVQDTLYNPKVKEHILKLSSTKNGLSHLCFLLYDKGTTNSP